MMGGMKFCLLIFQLVVKLSFKYLKKKKNVIKNITITGNCNNL